jgi:hypothetical protein
VAEQPDEVSYGQDVRGVCLVQSEGTKGSEVVWGDRGLYLPSSPGERGDRLHFYGRRVLGVEEGIVERMAAINIDTLTEGVGGPNLPIW